MRSLQNIFYNLSMYRVVLYGLLIVAGWGWLLTLLGVNNFNPVWAIVSLFVLVSISYISNKLVSRILGVGTNFESWLISSLILFLIFSPATQVSELVTLVVVAFIAQLSKYLLVIRGKHIFNPVAIGAVVVGMIGLDSASWWVATPWMMPVVVLTGALIVWKLKKLAMIGVFFAVAVVTLFITNWQIISSPAIFLYEIATSWPLLFFGLFMFTEPGTTPGRFYYQLVYGGVVGMLFGLKFGVGSIYSTPELALLIGNIFSFVVSNRQGMKLHLKNHKEIAKTIHEFRFNNPGVRFTPGQYLEWTLVHKNTDSRGNRRYFTIASSPDEKELVIATKISVKPSSFKGALLEMRVGDQVMATNLSGDFVVRGDGNMVWIAGGIGVTPFRSMAKMMIDKNINIDVVMFYACNNWQEMAYKEIFEKASDVGIRIVEVVKDQTSVPTKWNGEIGYVSEKMIKKYVSDWKDRKFYMSGPSLMVENYSKMLNGMGIKSSQIMTDFFPGY